MNKFKTINEFLDHLDEAKLEQVQALRRIILETEPNLVEHIKWNAPSYVFEGEDRLTFNLLNKQQLVRLVFHMGATRSENKNTKPIMNDQNDMMVWNSDIRGTVQFKDAEDIKTKAGLLSDLIHKWLSIK